MDYQMREILRGIGSGNIDETTGRALVQQWIDLEIETQKLIKTLYNQPQATPGSTLAPAISNV